MGGAPAPNAVQWRGYWFDPTTAAMLTELARISGDLYIRPIQGSWSAGENSAGTHGVEGAADINAESWTDSEALRVSALWRSLGGFGWFRPRNRPDGTPYGWQRHLHLGNPASHMAPELAQQWLDYKAGRNGLANKGPDPETRAYVGMTWARYLQERDEMTPEEMANLAQMTAKATADAVWAKVLTGHDEDAGGPLAAPKAKAESWLVMARRDAGRTYWNTDTLEAGQAQLRQAAGNLDAKAAKLEAAIEALEPIYAPGGDTDAAVAAFREALADFRVELVPIAPAPADGEAAPGEAV